jgi:hypothetical protein
MIDENQYTQLVLNASRFAENKGQFGGAVSAYDADVIAVDCSFTGNKVGALPYRVKTATSWHHAECLPAFASMFFTTACAVTTHH